MGDAAEDRRSLMARTLTALAEQSKVERSRMSLEQLMVGYIKATRRLSALQAIGGPRMILESCQNSVIGYRTEINTRLASLAEQTASEDAVRSSDWMTRTASLALGGA